MLKKIIIGLIFAIALSAGARAQVPAVGSCYGWHVLSNSTVTAQNVNGSALCGFLSITNLGSTTAGDVRIYDNASGGGGTSACLAPDPILNIPVPVNATAANIAGIVISLPVDISVKNGILVCISGAVADGDATSFAVGVQVNGGHRYERRHEVASSDRSNPLFAGRRSTSAIDVEPRGQSRVSCSIGRK